MRKLFIVVLASTMAIVSSLASCADKSKDNKEAKNAKTASEPLEVTMKKQLQPLLGEDVKIDGVAKSPYAGLYEVRLGSDILYTDENAKYVFVGSVIDAKSGENLTKKRTDEITAIKFSELPLDLALKSVRGDGSRVIAVFEDPYCSYCRVFRQTLAKVDNLTVYTFMYNILSEDSDKKSSSIWCSADASKAWDDWMLSGKQTPPAPDSCTTPNEKVYALGKKLRVTGTPTVFFVDGSRSSGVMNVENLEKRLNANAKSVTTN